MSLNKFCTAIGLAAVLAAPLFAAAGKKCLFIGNSLTDEVYATQDIAEGFGYTGCTWGRHMTPGCPIWLLWRDETIKDMFYYANNSQEGVSLAGPLADRLRDTAWDVVTLQVYPMNGDRIDSATVAGVLGFAAAAYQGNPACQVYIYESHPVYGDYPTPSAASNNPAYMTNDTTIYRPLADSITARYPGNKPALVIPANPVWHQMRLLVEAGRAPGLGSYLDLYSSDAGHASYNYGRYLLGLLFYATIYQQDPHGAMISGFKHLGWNNGVAASTTAQFANTAADVIWGVLCSYPMDGVAGTPTQRQVPCLTPAPAVVRDGMRHEGFSLAGRRSGTGARQAACLKVVDGVVTLRVSSSGR